MRILMIVNETVHRRYECRYDPVKIAERMDYVKKKHRPKLSTSDWQRSARIVHQMNMFIVDPQANRLLRMMCVCTMPILRENLTLAFLAQQPLWFKHFLSE